MLSTVCFSLFSFKYSSNAFLSLSPCFPHQVFFLSLLFFFLFSNLVFLKKKPSSDLAFILNPLSGSMTQRRQISAHLGMALLIPLKSDLFFDVVINFHPKTEDFLELWEEVKNDILNFYDILNFLCIC